AGMTGANDPFDRGTYPWPDRGGKPDDALLADYRKLTRLRKDNPVLRHGSIDAPAYIDDHVIVLIRRDGGQWAITATNNDSVAHTVKLDLPGTLAAASFTDAMTGKASSPANGKLDLDVPARYGTVLLLAHGTAQANVRVLPPLAMPQLRRERTIRVYLPP